MKKLIVLVILVGISGILALTNPSMDDYQHYIRQQIVMESQASGEALFGQALAAWLSGFAGGLAANQTIRDDYVVFSTYQLSFGKKRLRVLGLCKNFIVLESPERF